MKCSPGFPGGAGDKAGDIRVAGLIPGSGRSSGGGHGNPPQCSCLENSHGQRSLAGYSQSRHKSWTRLKRLSMHTCTDCSLPGSSLHGTLQVRRLEWVAIPFSRGLPEPGTEPRSPALPADSLLSQPPGKPWEMTGLSQFAHALTPTHPLRFCLE